MSLNENDMIGPRYEYLIVLENPDGSTTILGEPTVHEEKARDAFSCSVAYNASHCTGRIPKLLRRPTGGWEVMA